MHHEFIKERLSEFRKESDEVYDLKLADLVMMQMIGDFDGFLEHIKAGKKYEQIQALIENTRKQTTTEKLFPGIVDKTIEAQFGEKHATLRELIQNGIDSYEESEISRRVRVEAQEKGNYLELTVRDYGVGMDLATLVRDLLIPYNSAKEFDPTKIGEHGIGWYSIVDIAPVVRVVTRPKGSSKSCCAMIYRDEDYTWKASVIPSCLNGFKQHFDIHDLPGTEVSAHIPKTVTDKEKLRDYLHQYVGTISYEKGRIEFEGGIVNSVSAEYQKGMPVPVMIKDIPEKMTMAVSKRLISYGGRGPSDSRFKHRDENLSQVLYTQRGLFVKYSHMPFEKGTTHLKLSDDLISVGIDFWVDLPSNVTLTKGRNNIISDHVPFVVDGMYQCFESIFLDVLLNDDKLIDHPSSVICKSVSEIFDETYKSSIAAVQKREYTLRKRIVIQTVTNLSTAIDFFRSVSVIVGKNLVLLWKFLDRPISMREFFAVIKAPLLFVGAVFLLIMIVSAAFTYIPIMILLYSTLTVTAVALILTLTFVASVRASIKTFFELILRLPKMLAHAGLGCLSFLLIVLPQTIKSAVKSFSLKDIKTVLNSIGVSLRDVVDGTVSFGSIIKQILLFPLGFLFVIVEKLEKWIGVAITFLGGGFYKILCMLGLYQNMEERKEKKRAKKRKKISRKYLTGVYKDGFLKKIMHKKIIPAVHFSSVRTQDAGPVSKGKSFLRELFEDFFFFWKDNSNLGGSSSLYGRGRFSNLHDRGTEPELIYHKKRISIDELIDYYLTGKLFESHKIDNIDKYGRQNGDVAVHVDHPIVKTVTLRLSEISIEVRRQYNVQLFEDHLENVMRFLMGTIMTFYFAFIFIFPFLVLGLLIRALNFYPGYYQSYYYNAPEPITLKSLLTWYNLVSAGCMIHFVWMLFVREKNVLADLHVFKFMIKTIRFLFRQLFRMNRKNVFKRKKEHKLPKANVSKFEECLAKNQFGFAAWYLLKDVGVEIFEDVRLIVKTLSKFLVIYPSQFLLFLVKKGLPWCARGSVKIAQEGPGYVLRASKAGARKVKKKAKQWILIKKIRAAEKAEEKRIEEKRKKKEKKENEQKKEERKELKKRFFGKLSFFSLCYHSFLEWYGNSWLFGVIGYGEYEGVLFKRLKKSQVEAIVKTTGAARSYLDHLNVLERIDGLICDALRKTLNKKIKPFRFFYSYSGFHAQITKLHDLMSFSSNMTQVAFKLSLIPDFYSTPVKDSYTYYNLSRRNDLVNNRRMLCNYILFTLDGLIHLRAHTTSLGKKTIMVSPEHHASFSERKFDISRIVYSYFFDNAIDLEKEVSKDLSSWKNDDPTHHVPHAKFSKLTKMTYRRLRHEAYALEIEKKEMIQIKIDRRRKQEAKNRLRKIRDSMKGEGAERFEQMLEKIKKYSAAELIDLAERDQCPFEPEHINPGVIDPFPCEICGRLLYPGKPHPRETEN